uniref:ALS2 C-terminal like n=2 Tax=Leptobrachium leishanense TaxID=445787 RepID=A0A8C5PBD3_9ANUR
MSELGAKPRSRKLGRRCTSSTQESLVLVEGIYVKTVSPGVVESFLKKEEDFLKKLSLISSTVLNVLLQADESDTAGKDHLKSIIVINERFHALFDLTAGCYKTLTELHEESSVDVYDLYIVKKERNFIQAYTQYFLGVTNHIATKGFDRVSRAASNHWKSNKRGLKTLIAETLDISFTVFLQRVFTEPFRSHVQTYSLLLSQLSEKSGEDAKRTSSIDLSHAYHNLSKYIGQVLDEASQTKQLWATLSHKLTAALYTLERRLQEDSKNVPIVTTSGKQDRILLFDDVLVFIQGHETHICDLKTLWVDSSTKPTYKQSNQVLRIVTPEAEFLLSCKEPQNQALWQWKLNQLIRQRVNGSRDFPLWGKTGEANEPPTSRVSSYTYKNDSRYKNATYHGDMSWGKPHGKGTLTWPDGRNYVGDFQYGQENGFGVCLVPSSLEDRYDCYKCHWVNGAMLGYGICEFADESVYKGYFKDNMRHGYGVLENLASGSNPFKYTGNWYKDKMSGYGVWDSSHKGERYIGMWRNNQRQGHGIVLTHMGACYQGTFSLNKLVGPGILISEDGSVYEGEFTEECLLAGKGKLTFNNGFTLVGTFNRNQTTSGLQAQGVLNTSCEDLTESMKRKFQFGEGVLPIEERWHDIFEHFQKFLESGCRKETEESFLGFHVKSNKKLEQAQEYLYCQRESDDVSGKIEDILKEMSLHLEQESMQCYLEKAFKSSHHPLMKLMKELCVAYQATYSGIGSNLHLLSMAQEEIKHYATKIWEFYSALKVMASGENKKVVPAGGVEEISEEVNPYTVVLPPLLPYFHEDLSMLYMLYHQQEDKHYWQGIVRLGTLTDTKLLEFLDVQRQLWPLKDIKLTANQRYSIVRHKCFHSATECLQKITTVMDPRQKLEIILKTYAEIEKTVLRVVDKDYKLPMDDLLPLLIYVVSRAGIQRLGAEIHFIYDLMDPSIRGGIYDFLLTALESCYEHIQREEIRLYK